MKNKKHTLLKLFPAGIFLCLPLVLTAQDNPENDVPDIEEPPIEVPQGPPADVQEFLDSLRELQDSFLAVVQAEYDSGEMRAAAIQEWISENRNVIDDLEEVQESVNVEAAGVVLPDEALAERQGPSENAVDLEALLEEKLANVARGNEDLQDKLELAELDREERLAALMQARDERLAEMEAAKELARQKREEARENGQGDRRNDDDAPGGG